MNARAQSPMSRVASRVRLLAIALALAVGCADTRHAIVTPDGTGLYAELRGEGARTVVLPLGSRFAPYLGDQAVPGARWLVYDPRARGRSDFPRFGRVGLAADVQDLEVLLRAHELDDVVLVGWWYTAAVAARYAMRHPERVRALILIAPMPVRRWPHVRDADRAMAQRPGAEELAAMEERARGAEGATPEFCRELYAATLRVVLHDPALASGADTTFCDQANESPARLAGLMGDIFSELGDWDWRDTLREIPVPALVVHGASDPMPVTSAEDWVATLAHSNLVVIPGMGRIPWLEAGDELNAAITRFLDELAP